MEPTSLKSQKKPRWISHRGYCKDEIENSLASFRAAKANGFSAFETDLRLSSDGELFLCHDRFLGRLGSNEARPVDMMTRKELASLELRKGGRLLFFDALLSEFSSEAFIFDVKEETGHAVIKALAAFVGSGARRDEFFARSRFLFWRKSQQDAFCTLFPEGRCLPRQEECWRAGLAVLTGLPSLGGLRRGASYALPPRFAGIKLYREPIVARYHGAGASVMAYLPHDIDAARLALAIGVDEILTDGLITDHKITDHKITN